MTAIGSRQSFSPLGRFGESQPKETAPIAAMNSSIAMKLVRGVTTYRITTRRRTKNSKVPRVYP
ncbi:hypothetical protein, partial [Saccharothrix sp. ST-888]|uniref:hypothetical protein n=1 Tax=Saccharothrix sp. ST-888 TaxID=1427391 RepID=UPI001E5AF858